MEKLEKFDSVGKESSCSSCQPVCPDIIEPLADLAIALDSLVLSCHPISSSADALLVKSEALHETDNSPGSDKPDELDFLKFNF